MAALATAPESFHALQYQLTEAFRPWTSRTEKEPLTCRPVGSQYLDMSLAISGQAGGEELTLKEITNLLQTVRSKHPEFTLRRLSFDFAQTTECTLDIVAHHQAALIFRPITGAHLSRRPMKPQKGKRRLPSSLTSSPGSRPEEDSKAVQALYDMGRVLSDRGDDTKKKLKSDQPESKQQKSTMLDAMTAAKCSKSECDMLLPVISLAHYLQEEATPVAVRCLVQRLKANRVYRVTLMGYRIVTLDELRKFELEAVCELRTHGLAEDKRVVVTTSVSPGEKAWVARIELIDKKE